MYFESTNIQRATWGSTICIRVQERPLLRCPKGNYSGALGHKVLSLNLISIKQPAPYFDPQFWLFSDRKLLQYVARFFLLATQDFGQCSSCLSIFKKSVVELLSGKIALKFTTRVLHTQFAQNTQGGIVKGGGKQFSKPVKSPLYKGSLDRRRI